MFYYSYRLMRIIDTVCKISTIIKNTLSEQRYTRSVKNQFHPLLRCFHSVYVQYTSIKRLAGIEIAFFPTLRP